MDELAKTAEFLRALSLALYTLAFLMALYIAVNIPRLRWWLLPVIVYLALGVTFYALVLSGLLADGTLNALSAMLRLYSITSITVALGVMWSLARKWQVKT